MAVIGRFIGIDKYTDQVIPDLTGAKRDATALWALFTDTLTSFDSKLVTDQDATHAEVSKILDETLESATDADTIILSFAGHGTHDHRLVLHDSVATDLSNTTISMESLAERFKNSKAKLILCILDCCFSGGAPARVLADSPIPRGPGFPIQELSGEGRVIIAASNIDEPSYETPSSGHGLLTKALIDVLQEIEESISVASAMEKVMDKVRAEAARIGVQQTPVLFGTIVGGYNLPKLLAGTNYSAAFPDRTGVHVTKKIEDLVQLGIDSVIIEEWKKNFSTELNDLQLKAINDYRILDGKSLLVIAPTSSGKTFVGEMSAAKAITQGKKAVFLFPYRALTSEKYDQFVELYTQKMGVRVIRCTGDYQDNTESFVRGKYDIALLTYEMFLNIAVGNPPVLNNIGLVVLDEGQFITDPNRGITVELLLTYLLTSRSKGISPQLIVLSAVIGQTSGFEDWLGCKVLMTTDRPTPLIEGVIDRSGVFKYLDVDGQTKTTQIIPASDIRVRRDKPSSQDVIVPLVKKLVGEGENIMIFRNQKGKAQGCANYLSDELGLPSATDAIELLPTHDQSSSSAALRKALSGGTAFHNTNLTREERSAVEKIFRNKDSSIKALAATTTVAAGINTPASTVILAEQQFIGEDGRPFTIAEYKNMAGRAGRYGYSKEGKSIIIADPNTSADYLFNTYVLGNLDSLHSSFDVKDLNTWLLRLFAQVKSIKKTDVLTVLTNTWGGYLAIRKDPEWEGRMKQQLEALLQRMLELELLEEEGDSLRLTLLGRACGTSGLKFESSMRLVEVLRGLTGTDLTIEQLMALVQILPEADNGYTPMYKRGRGENMRPQQATQKYGSGVVTKLQKFADDENDYYARCKRASILYDWINGAPVDQIEKTYTMNAFSGVIGHGEIRRFADATRFHLRSACQLAQLIFTEGIWNDDTTDTLLKQLEVGLPKEALGLLNGPITLSRGEYLLLHNNGIISWEKIKTTTAEHLTSLLGEARSKEITEALSHA